MVFEKRSARMTTFEQRMEAEAARSAQALRMAQAEIENINTGREKDTRCFEDSSNEG